MGVSRFFKSFFDPLIELYRPVPPLAWAPLILTIFGIQDDGKIFLLFMVAFAIMVISARTGASGTQLSKIRAAHSLGATQRQIVRYVILPNALPEILTGVRIAVVNISHTGCARISRNASTREGIHQISAGASILTGV